MHVSKVNEYLICQICSVCKERKLAKKEGLHAVLRCQDCDIIWNRDENASANIRDMLFHMVRNRNERPNAFRIPEKKN